MDLLTFKKEKIESITKNIEIHYIQGMESSGIKIHIGGNDIVLCIDFWYVEAC